MAYCSKCGTELTEGVKFCPKCGQAVGEVTNSIVNKRKTKRQKASKQVNGRVNELSSSTVQTQEDNNSSEDKGSWADTVTVSLGIGLLIMLGITILEGSWLAIIIAICGIVVLFFLLGSDLNNQIKALSAIIISLAALYGSFKMIDNKTNEEIKEIVQDAKKQQEKNLSNAETVTVDQMLNELDQNAMRAQKKYSEKWYEVIGRLGTMDSEGEYFILDGDGGWTLTNVKCIIPEAKRKKLTDKVATMERGERIAVKGVIIDMGEVMGYEIRIEDVYRKPY